MGKALPQSQDHVRSVATKQRYSADERELGTHSVGPVLPTQHIATNAGDSGSVKNASGRVSPAAAAANGITLLDGLPSGSRGNHTAHAASDKHADATITSSAARASPADKSKAEGDGDTAIGNAEDHHEKLPIPARLAAGSKRFLLHMKNAMCYSWLNVLLIFVPIGIAVDVAHLDPAIIFAINAVAIVPLAGLLAHATEIVASQLGSNIGALLNVTFGNAVELIIFIIALTKNEVSVIQAALLGSILSNLLLILGMAFLLGGLRYQEQIYNSTVTQMSACLLTLSVASLVLPTAFHASFNDSSTDQADTKILEVSRGTSVILLLIYILYLLFQLKSHAYMYEATPQHVIDEESHPGLLHAMLDSSSSSSDSDSDGDSSSSSSTSRSTAGRRLKRMLKHRRRRKSSASTSTAGTVSMPSVSSPSGETRDNYFDGRSQQTSRRTSPLGVIVSGDEADVDAERDRATAPRIRDFVSLDGEAISSAYHRRKHRKKYRRKHKQHRQIDVEKADMSKENEIQQAPNPEPVMPTTAVELTELSEKTMPLDAAVPRRPINIRSLSTRGPTIAPTLSRLLTNNVFVTQPHNPPQTPAINRLRSEGALRRANSLPDRLNEQQPPVQSSQPVNQLQQTPSRRTAAPHVRIAAVVGDDETIVANEKHKMSRTAAIVLLICSTAFVAVCAEFMVGAIPQMLANSPSVSEAFIGLIILPIVGNAAEHVTAVTVAAKNKMDLAIGVAVGSSIQIALFVTPLIVLLGWIMKVEMSLYFNIFETVSLFVAVLVVNFLCLDGRSNYLEGALLIAAYIIIALVAFYYPGSDARSAIGGGSAA